VKRKKAAQRKVRPSGSKDSEPLCWMRQTGPHRFEIKTAPSFRGPVGIVPDEYKQFFVTQSQQLIERIQQEITLPALEEWSIFPPELIADLKELKIPSGGWEPYRKLLERGMLYGFMTGAFLVHLPEATAIRTALARGRKKGGAVNRMKAEPGRAAIRKRFRELRKSGFTKTDARKVLEQETKKSFRQIERDTLGLS
jgi:hypothetical protein